MTKQASNVGKERFWEHVASNEHYTALFVHPQRGAAAHQTGTSILPSFQNWAVHDCWPTYAQEFIRITNVYQ